MAHLSQLGFQFAPSLAKVAGALLGSLPTLGLFGQIFGQSLDLLLHRGLGRLQIPRACFQLGLFGATVPALKQTLQWVARLPAGSEIVLTFDLPCAQAESMKTITRERGIRFETFFEPDEMLALLGGCGLAGEVFTPAQLNELYFRGRDDGLHAHTWEWLAVGRVE